MFKNVRNIGGVEGRRIAKDIAGDSLLSTGSRMQHYTTINLISFEPTAAVSAVNHTLVEKIGVLRVIVYAALLRHEIADVIRLHFLYH